MLKQKDINIGIIGYGVIGQTLEKWLLKNTKCKITLSDPPKGIHNDLDNCNLFFINIHIPTEKNGIQNLSDLENIISHLPKVPIFIRTTLLPGTSDQLSRKFCRSIYFMPEFLTERSAFNDFCSQGIVITGNRELLDEIFKNKKRIYMSNMEAELSKYAHNVFGALKVTYFNEIYRLCQEAGLKYKNVLNAVLMSGYINSTHTSVPGPDGKLGYGGKCLPKDIKAFEAFNKDNELSKILKQVIQINEKLRKDIQL